MNRIMPLLVSIIFLSACMQIQGDNSPAKLNEYKMKRILRREFQGMFGMGSFVDGPFTIEEIESESLERISACKSCPQVPFGNINGKWEEFKSLYQDGDLIELFSTDTKSWNRLSGRSGYALI